jgi:predicted NAD-dependent protein-ADP-ribosyltransferase YbiA (DUF1768 family)
VLNIKFILLSHEAFRDGDFGNVLTCGQLNDSILQDQQNFQPDYYIIVEYNGYHYKLIGYKKKQIFTFKELPYGIKELVVDKCMEKNAGVFSLIPDFIKFKNENKGNNQELSHFEELTESKIRGLYEDDIEFRFNAQSSGKKLPGLGAGEKIPKEMIREFSELATIPDWRKKLDDSWSQPFILDNHKWNSVIHYMEASKFKNTNPEFYLSFTVESGTPLSKNSEIAKAAGSKKGKYEGELIRPIKVKIDPEYNTKKEEKNINNALQAKFTQNEDLKKMIIATKNAKLVHSTKSKEPKIADNLMLLRDELR